MHCELPCECVKALYHFPFMKLIGKKDKLMFLEIKFTLEKRLPVEDENSQEAALDHKLTFCFISE